MPRRTFEAVLRPEVVTLTPAVRQELLALGVDPDHLAATYELPTLRAAFDVIRRQECAALDEASGFREVGRRFVQGFKQTPIGWIFAAMAPRFGAVRTIQQLPRYLTSVREEFPVTVVAEGETRYRLLCADSEASADFMAGCIEGVLLTCGVETCAVGVLRVGPGFELEISW